MEKIIAALTRYKSYISIIGLCCVCFYFISEKVLSLGIYAPLHEGNTYALLSSVLWYFFILAIVAVGVGGMGFLLEKLGFKPDPNTRANEMVISDVALKQNGGYKMGREKSGKINVKRN
jgi:hypothetical protein